MAVGNSDDRKFITTEPLAEGDSCAQVVWEAVRGAFAERNCLAYWRYPLFSRVGQVRKEPDIVIVDRELGLSVLEVVRVTIEQIAAIQGDAWEFQNVESILGSPAERTKSQLQALLGHCDRESALFRQVAGRGMIVLPLITQEQWQQRGFELNPSIVFQNDLDRGSFLPKVEQSNPLIPGISLDEQQWELLLAVLGGTSVLRKPPRINSTQQNGHVSRSSIIAALQENLHELDLQQVHIGTEIPPGVQRIRGIAGSGKTVLLCQKAAHMHLKHPDWDIALVFFTRSLYDPIEKLLDRWMRHFSDGEVSYDLKARQKLRVLHAWGADNQPGLYGTIAESHERSKGTIVDDLEPHEGLAYRCKELLEEIDRIEPIFDAILIDEGQDLVIDRSTLKYQGRQSIYWLAYQALRPVDPEHPEQRRLIWAYDEAQSLNNLVIPNAVSLFGAGFENLVRGQYKGGIKKSEIMCRCYRTPGPILTAAHAIGMGLLRPEGLLSGITNKEGWEKIGYKVTGKFLSGQQVTLHRPPQNSPNQVPQLWGQSVLEFEVYGSRTEELTALANNIQFNLREDGLQPSREILVIVLGSRDLEAEVAKFLMGQNINIYIPSAPQLNTLEFHWKEQQPNQFWHEGGVTVSRIHRAKGNEADMVYVVGFDNVAQKEDNVGWRNQLFVALTRARGWAMLSGIGDYPMYQEMQHVLDSKDTFTFTFKKPPKRSLRDDED